MNLIFSLVLAFTVTSPSDTVEWANWGHSQAFFMKYQRSVNDTTMLHGDFESYFKGNLIMKGSFKQNRKDGLWEHFDPITRKLSARGYYRHGHRNGRWEFFVADGLLRAQKDYKGGLPAGYHTSYYGTGKKRCEVKLKNDTTIESVVLFYARGDTLLRRDCKPTEWGGQCTHRSYYRKGPRYEDYNFIIDRRDSLVQKMLARGEDYLSEVFLLDPVSDELAARSATKLNGSYRKYHTSGRLWEQLYYDEGKLINALATYSWFGRNRDGGDFINGNGTHIRYSSRGDTARIENHLDGLRNGQARYFEPRNRKRAEGYFEKGKPSGRWTLRGSDQHPRAIVEFHSTDSASIKGLKRKHLDAFEGSYTKNLRQGKWVLYDYYGDTLAVEHYQQGLLHGRFKLFTSGLMERVGNYYKGVPDGKWYTFNRSGKVTWVEDFTAMSSEVEYAPPYVLEFDHPIFSQFDYSYKSTEATLLREFAFLPWDFVLDGKPFLMEARAGRADGEVIFAVDIEDTGHIVQVTALSAGRQDFFEAAAEYMGSMPYMRPASFEGMPRKSRQLVSFYFSEIR